VGLSSGRFLHPGTGAGAVSLSAVVVEELSGRAAVSGSSPLLTCEPIIHQSWLLDNALGVR